MAAIAKLYNTDFSPAAQALIDLGRLTQEWKDLFIDGIAYIDTCNIEVLLEMNDNDIISVQDIEGIDGNVRIEMGTSGRMLFTANGAGAPFATPDFSFAGTSYFNDHLGLDTNKQVQFRDTELYIHSNDDGHLDLAADTAIDLNTPDVVQTTGSTNFILPATVFTSAWPKSVSNTATETTLLNSGSGTLTIPANFLDSGKTLKLEIRGTYNTKNGPTTLRLRGKVGNAAVVDTGVNVIFSGASTREFEMDALITCQIAGASGAGVLAAQGKSIIFSGPSGSQLWEMRNTSTFDFDTTTAQTVNVTAQWGEADSSNSITSTNVLILALN